MPVQHSFSHCSSAWLSMSQRQGLENNKSKQDREGSCGYRLLTTRQQRGGGTGMSQGQSSQASVPVFSQAPESHKPILKRWTKWDHNLPWGPGASSGSFLGRGL